MSGQATASVPLLHRSHSSGCISTHALSLNDLLGLTCFQWQPSCFFKNKLHVPQSHPSPTFPHLFSHAFPSAPPPGFHVVLRLRFCPRLPLPCACSEQAVMGATGSSSGRARVCFVVSSRALL